MMGTPPDRQAFCGVNAVDPLVIDVGVLGAQYVVDHAVAPTPTDVSSLHDLLAQFCVERAGLTLMTIRISA